MSRRAVIVAVCAAMARGGSAFAQEIPSLREEQCAALDLGAVERLLAIEWRDSALSRERSTVRAIELRCEPRSVRVRVVTHDDTIQRERAIDVAPGEWAVAPRFVSLVAAQLAVAIEREHEDLERAARAARESVASQRVTVSVGPSAAVGADRSTERWWIDGALGLRARQWAQPWWSVGPSSAIAARVGGTPVWFGAWIDSEFGVRDVQLGAVRFARVAIGPAVTVASARDAAVGVFVRASVLVGAQSLWANAERPDVATGALVSSTIEARARVALVVRVSRAWAVAFGADAAIELSALEGVIGASSTQSTAGLSLGGSLALQWRGR